VALVNRHAKGMALYCHLWSVRSTYFSTLFKKKRGRDFRKENVAEHRMYILIFLQILFSETFSLKEIFNEISLMYIGLQENTLYISNKSTN
jgi:hypothetical protein